MMLMHARPCLSSSFLGLFVLLFSFGVSDRYDLSKPAGTGGAIVALVFSVLYAGGTIYSYQRLLAPTSAEQSGTSLKPLRTLYRQITDLREPGMTRLFPGEAPVQIIRQPEASVEEEETRRQMSRLMSPDPRNRQTNARDSARSTYHLDWPQYVGHEPQTPHTPATPRPSLSPGQGPLRTSNMDLPAHVQAYYDMDEHTWTGTPVESYRVSPALTGTTQVVGTRSSLMGHGRDASTSNG